MAMSSSFLIFSFLSHSSLAFAFLILNLVWSFVAALPFTSRIMTRYSLNARNPSLPASPRTLLHSALT
eukprot:CAMPEP_0182484846 /NCGR_PEP_ID=MMETSP1319-20130603/44162_1 /TAXON_ID=172717 /ORGANISM="Bolidomonas pacifica, Strain RCC208" /LENGTH=67 /DNA_ID=CAMNT_0024686771 /DNA_START=186 /DNA_END=385 /DNA_ORIENTATION=-